MHHLPFSKYKVKSGSLLDISPVIVYGEGPTATGISLVGPVHNQSVCPEQQGKTHMTCAAEERRILSTNILKSICPIYLPVYVCVG